MQRNTVCRSLGLAGVLAPGSIVIAYAQQRPAPPTPVTGQWPDLDCTTSKLTAS